MTHTAQRLIVGGGPIGLFLASKMPESILVDAKASPGTAVSCAGLVTDSIYEFLTRKEVAAITVNKPTQTIVKGPHSQLEVAQKHNIVIDNKRFEELLHDKALKAGSEIRQATRYVNSTAGAHRVKTKAGSENVQAPSIYGADGPHSKVRRSFGLKAQETMMGWQARVKGAGEDETIRFYPHIGRYAWEIPEGDGVMRVGVAGTKREFDAFLKGKGQVIDTQHGPIPLHDPRMRNTTARKKVTARMVGDAGGHIKNTTGGGIIPGMKAVRRIAQHKPTMPLNAQLYSHFLVHNITQTFSARDWDRFITAGGSYTDMLSKHNREDATRLMGKLAGNTTYWKMSLGKLLSGRVRIL